MSLTPRQLGEQLRQRKQQRQQIAVLTAWDALSASWAEAAEAPGTANVSTTRRAKDKPRGMY